MERKGSDLEQFEKAKKRVDLIKVFYAHLVLFFIGTTLLFLFKGRIIDYVKGNLILDEGFLHWLEWNLILIPVLWAMALGVGALFIFRGHSNLIKRWEERQFQKFLKEEERKSH